MKTGKRKLTTLFAGICWLLMTIVNCSVVQAMPMGEIPDDAPPASQSHADHLHDAGSMAMDMDHDQMTCCDSSTQACCQQVAPGLPSKFDESPEDPSANPALQETAQAVSPVLLVAKVPRPPDWRMKASFPSLHLMYCSFLD